MRWSYKFHGWAAAACFVGLLMTAGYSDLGVLPFWAVLALAFPLTLAFCVLTMRGMSLYKDERRRQRRAERAERIDDVKRGRAI